MTPYTGERPESSGHTRRRSHTSAEAPRRPRPATALCHVEADLDDDGRVIGTGQANVKVCPYCGKPHTHGIPEGTDLSDLGTRRPHCEDRYSRTDPGRRVWTRLDVPDYRLVAA